MLFHTFLLVFVAEMADKTQFMIIALTHRFPIKTILLGMVSGIVVIVGLSVLAGDLIGNFVPISTVKLCGGIMFILFGIWNLKKTKEDTKQHNTMSRLPIISIAFSFILAELGDKTQLATVAMAADHMGEHLPIFIGATLGLVMANLIGIFAGKLIFTKLSEDHVKLLSSFFFFFFGSTTLFEAIPGSTMIYVTYSIVLMLVAFLMYSLSRKAYN